MSSSSSDRPFKWTPGTQPRDPNGRFIKTNLEPGWYPYTRGGEIRKYYLNDIRKLKDGYRVLEMGAQPRTGNQFDGVDKASAIERVHGVASADDELMYVSADTNRTCGLIEHDTLAPPEPFSYSRYSLENMPTSEYMPPSDTGFGGSAARGVNGSKGETYDTLAAQEAEQLNAKAFEDPNRCSVTMDPADIAKQAAAARHWYQEMGIKESDARKLPVYVHIENGNLKVTPAMRVTDGVPSRKSYPHTKDGGHVVKLQGSELTRMTRAMERDGIKECQFAVTAGTHLSKNGNPLNNALQYRADVSNDRSGRSRTLWGTIEKKQQAVTTKVARDRFVGPDGKMDAKGKAEYHRAKVAEMRRHAAPYHNPGSRDDASELLHYRYGGGYSADRIEMSTDGTFSYTNEKNHTRTRFDAKGEEISTEFTDVAGFRNFYNRGRGAEQGRISKARVMQTDDGFAIREARGTRITARFDKFGKRIPINGD